MRIYARMLKLNVEILFSSKFEHFSSILANFQEWRIKKKIKKKKKLVNFQKKKKEEKEIGKFSVIEIEIFFSNEANEIVVE